MTLRLALPATPYDRIVAVSLHETFAQTSPIDIRLTQRDFTEEAAIEALVAGDIDIALVSNSMPYRDELATVIPMYPTVLHMGYTGDRDVSDLESLLGGARVFAGVPGSASRVMFTRMVERQEHKDLDYTFIERPSADDPADVWVVFTPVSPQVLFERIGAFPEFRLAGLGDPADIGQGSVVDAATLINPYLRPFVIPAGVYGEATPEPVLTLAVDKLLLARSDLDRSVVYDLINELLRLRPALSARNPQLFRDLTGEFDARSSTFVLHPGTQAYLQRSAPSVYERYSGIAEVVVTVLIGLASAIVAGVRIYRMRRKNRIDTFYSRTLAILRSVSDESSDEKRRKAVAEVRQLQNEAFDLLVDERLDADESFRIFITLSNDALRQLGADVGEPRLSDV